uniref:replication restart helicase PriA n=1 Tax=Candidatus Ventrenecus sp. TaxID=3085654 RepID=UPI004025B7EB
MYINVLTEIKNKKLDKTFTYKVPFSLENKIAIGKRVLIPFNHLTLEGYIVSLTDEAPLNPKEILEVLDEEPVLTEEMLILGKFLHEKTLSSLTSCYDAMLPKALKAKKGTNINIKKQSYLSLKMPYEEALKIAQNEKQKEIILAFKEQEEILKKEISLISSSAMNTLLKKDVLQETYKEKYRYEIKNSKATEKTLNEEQQRVYEKIKQAFHTNKTYLLHGVTGSGKTEVYINLIKDVLKEGKTALVLVPEISLTPQLIERFTGVFQTNIAVLHSGLSDAEKYDEWRKILKEEVSIVIGARSASFAPLKNIGIFILDEEHSESYKQENNPRYHALDVILKRSEIHHAPVVLGSATPSLSTMARAHKKVFEYTYLSKRAKDSVLPEVYLVDMAEENKKSHPIISRLLENKITEKIEKKEQVMILLNRRGYSTTLTCSNCGFTYRCPNCQITLTYHKKINQLRCHYCGYTKYYSSLCPNCHEEGLNDYGMGTEKLEEYLEKKFPMAKIIRMDRDTTAKKGTHEQIIEDFQNQKYDILLGTQMISKGLDFPNVTLVGILNADTTLNIPDYRSNEKTFALLSQTCGRAGRNTKKGEVVLQTFNPDNYIMKCVSKNDYFSFYKYEMNIRKTLKYPPFYYLANLIFKSKDYEKVAEEAKKAKNYLEQNLDSGYIILGPTAANVFMMNKIYHFEISIKYKKADLLVPVLKDLFTYTKVDLDIDFNF